MLRKSIFNITFVVLVGINLTGLIHRDMFYSNML